MRLLAGQEGMRLQQGWIWGEGRLPQAVGQREWQQRGLHQELTLPSIRPQSPLSCSHGGGGVPNRTGKREGGMRKAEEAAESL